MFKNNKIFAFICISIFITIIYFSLPTLTHAQNIVVNSLLDDGDGTCTTKCTFTDAINTSSDGDEITFSVTGTIVLDGEHSRGLDHDLTITGPGIEELTLDMNAGPDAILEQDDGDFEISNLTITNGADTLVVSYGSLTISDVLFIENSASTLLDLEGLSANLNNVSFIENTTQNYTIYSCASYLNITNSTFSGYTTASISRYILEDGCAGEINIANSTFFNNTSKIQAINSYSDISITNSTFYSSNENAPIQITSDNDSVSITITNSVLYSTADNNCGVEIVSLGNNIETGSSCRFNHTDDITNPAHYLMLHEFDGTTGSSPQGSLVESNGVFYGMTNRGGTDGVGVIFSYDPSNTGSEYDVLYEFDDTTGSSPRGSLVESNGVFYGMTNRGGTDGVGVIFSYDPSNTGSEYDMLYEFDDTTGSYPYGSLVESNGVFYGMTNRGGTDGVGVIFSYDPSNTGSEYDVLYEFDDTTGSSPLGSLVESNGVFYGMTLNGGTNGVGVIFSYDPSNTGSEYDMLYEFDDTTGSSPRGSLVESNGVFYGMTNDGGTGYYGVIFSYDPSNTGSEYDMLYEFDDTTGSYPYGSLVESNGVFYGMTNDGGTDGVGVIFSYDPSNTGSEYDMLYEFDDTTGSYPYGSLVESNGVLYGMTNKGGTDAVGVIFSYSENRAQIFDPESIFETGELKDNGGPVMTIALASDGPAIDSGNDAEAPETDARGYERYGVSDIGAYEYTPPEEPEEEEPQEEIQHSTTTSGSYRYIVNMSTPTIDTTPPTDCLPTYSFSPSTGKACPSSSFEQTQLYTPLTTSPLLLKFGMNNPLVSMLQNYLNTHGYPVAQTGAGSLNNETNYFGQKTLSAVKIFQTANNLVPDGVVGPKTREMMK